MDVATDLGATPTSCSLLDQLDGRVDTHAVMGNLVRDDFRDFSQMWDDLIRTYEITQVAFTGHSLAGGLAQIAHLAFMLRSPEMTLNTVVFAAPMVFFLP